MCPGTAPFSWARGLIFNLLLLLTAGLGFAAQPGCESCHADVARSFSKTGMGESVGLPQDGRAHFRHDVSGSQLSVRGKVHRIERQGLTAEYPVGLRIGSGKAGSSFGVRIGGKWFESPVSWYAQSSQFRMSPGYEREKHPDFDRPIRDECLSCHGTTRASEVVAITCERCHGNGVEHAANPARQNIVSPARLTGARRDSICEQCHLPGVVRILNPGVKPEAFAPGQLLEGTWTTYVAGEDFRVASHVEQLALSACMKASGPELWCGSCHNPHPTAARPSPSVDAVCRDCHQPHEGGAKDCATCHMPKRGVRDVVHTSYTDHRIQRTDSAHLTREQRLRPWRVNPRYEKRNAALALFRWGAASGDAPMVQDAFRNLIDLPAADRAEPAVLSALGAIALLKGRPREASDWLTEAARMEPANSEAQLRLGRAEQASGRPGAALEHYEAAIGLNPLFFEAYVLSAQIERSRGNDKAAGEVLRRYLRHVPQSLAARQALPQGR